MATVKDDMIRLILEQPDDSSFDEILKDWRSVMAVREIRSRGASTTWTCGGSWTTTR